MIFLFVVPIPKLKTEKEALRKQKEKEALLREEERLKFILLEVSNLAPKLTIQTRRKYV